MVRVILFLAGWLSFCAAAAAEDAASGRYQLAPDGDGFVRLDTETGGLAHCDRSEGVWRCAVILEDHSDVERRILALQQDLTALKGGLEDLSERLAAIEKGEGAVVTPPVSRDQPSQQPDEEFDEALSFAERMMQRFFDMIRELKNEQPPQQI